MTPRIPIRLAAVLGGFVILIEATVLLSLGSYYLRHFGHETSSRLMDSLRKPAALLTSGALSTDAFGHRNTMTSIVGPALDDAMIVSAEGVVLMALDPSRIGRRWQDFPELSSDWLVRAASGGFDDCHVFGPRSYIVSVAPLAAAGGEAPALFSYVRVSMAENERELAALRVRLIGGSVAAMIVTTVALLFAVHFLVARRLRRIAKAVERITDGHYDTSLGKVGLQDEIGFLQTGFDTMTKRLQSTFESLKQATRETEAAEQKYRLLVENAAESILVIQSGAIAFANGRALRMFEWPESGCVGRPLGDLFHADDRDWATDRHARRMRGESPLNHYEARMLTSSGRNLWAELNVVVIEWKHLPAALAFVTDITDRKRAEAEQAKLQSQLIQAQRMESIGRLAGGVAHDFNNMLHVILGNASLALSDLSPDNPVRENIDEIKKSAQRSAELTRQLLTFARKQAVTPQTININECIEGMLKMLDRLIGEHIPLSWLPGANLRTVKMDPSQLDQIMANLCVNARDAINGAGKIMIETNNVTLDDTYAVMHPECLPGDYVRLCVSDTGSGMDTETLTHIFEPFFTTKEAGRGTGLGLATVFGIVKQNRGLINVYSEPGKGSTFKIYLPGGTGSITPKIEPAEPLQRGSETILIVEDEEQVLMLGRKSLTHRGYRVLSASSPEAALALVAQTPEPIHLLLTDVVMPGMNGRELRDRLRASRPDLRCIFMSGYTADIIARHGVLEDGFEFVQKPFTLLELGVKVRRVLDQPLTG